MRRIITGLITCCLLVSSQLSAATLDIFKDQKGQIDIAGGTAHIPVMVQAAKDIMQANPQINITIAAGGSGVGVQKVGNGLVEIGNTGRELKADEIEKYGLVSFAFAIDGVAAVLNPENPITELSSQQLIDIFAGKITNWQDVGGADALISLYVREDGSGTKDVFENKALKKNDVINKANVVNSNGAMKTSVTQDKNAIGYVGIGHLDDSIKGLIVEGMVPSQENAANGSYTIVRKLYMNTKGEPTGLVKDFINYIYSDDGANIIIKSGYIPVKMNEK